MSLFHPIESPKHDLYSSDFRTAYKSYTSIPDMDHAVKRNIDYAEEINLDASFRHAIDYKKKLVAGSIHKLIAKTSSKLDNQRCNIFKEMFGFIKDFPKSRFALANALFEGVAYCYIRGRRRFVKLGDFPAQYWWIPEQLKPISKWRIKRRFIKGKVYFYMFSLDEEKWKLIDSRALVTVTNTDEERFYGQGNGLYNSLWHTFFAKKSIEEMALKYAERFCSGILKVGIDHNRSSGDNRKVTDVQDDYLAMAREMYGNGVISYDLVDTLEYLQPPGGGWEVLQFLLNYYGDEARLCAIGANLPVNAGEVGSYSLGQVQENSVMMDARYGRMLIETAMEDHVIRLIAELNQRQFYQLGLGDANNPSFSLPEEREKNPQEALQVAKLIQELTGEVITREVYENSLYYSEPVEGEDRTFKAPQGQGGGGGGMDAITSMGAGQPAGPQEDLSGESQGSQLEPADEMKDKMDLKPIPTKTATAL